VEKWQICSQLYISNIVLLPVGPEVPLLSSAALSITVLLILCVQCTLFLCRSHAVATGWTEVPSSATADACSLSITWEVYNIHWTNGYIIVYGLVLTEMQYPPLSVRTWCSQSGEHGCPQNLSRGEHHKHKWRIQSEQNSGQLTVHRLLLDLFLRPTSLTASFCWVALLLLTRLQNPSGDGKGWKKNLVMHAAAERLRHHSMHSTYRSNLTTGAVLWDTRGPEKSVSRVIPFVFVFKELMSSS